MSHSNWWKYDTRFRVVNPGLSKTVHNPKALLPEHYNRSGMWGV